MALSRGIETVPTVPQFYADATAALALQGGFQPFDPTSRLQLPALGIERIEGITACLPVTDVEIPWLNRDMEVSLRRLHLVGGASVLYGSMVSGNNTLTRLARIVCPERSEQAQKALFTSLPGWLEGHDMPDIHPVDKNTLVRGLYKAGRGKHDPARLFFLRTNNGEDPTPVILKVAVARHKDQDVVVSILTSRRRRGFSGMR